MQFIRNLFGSKEPKIGSYSDFWAWFQTQEQVFFKVIKERGNVEKHFFDKISPKLAQIKEGFFFLVGMLDENTIEVVFTADGVVKNIVFIEELVAAAPPISGWKFTALKPPLEIAGFSIAMNGYEFKDENIFFVENKHPNFPDEIDITVLYEGLNEQNRTEVSNGLHIFLDNYLGELYYSTTIDAINFENLQNKDDKALIPITKLKAYLAWREKEFVEKYEGTRRNTEQDLYTILEAKLENGNPLLAVIKTELLQWDKKASHAWLLQVILPYDNKNLKDLKGLPDEKTLQLLNEIEDAITAELTGENGHLNIGTQTAEGIRAIYFVCKDFRKAPKILDNIVQKYSKQIAISYEIYKDKYWKSFEHFG